MIFFYKYTNNNYRSQTLTYFFVIEGADIFEKRKVKAHSREDNRISCGSGYGSGIYIPN